jgi:hypothetical protein
MIKADNIRRNDIYYIKQIKQIEIDLHFMLKERLKLKEHLSTIQVPIQSYQGYIPEKVQYVKKGSIMDDTEICPGRTIIEFKKMKHPANIVNNITKFFTVKLNTLMNIQNQNSQLEKEKEQSKVNEVVEKPNQPDL